MTPGQQLAPVFKAFQELLTQLYAAEEAANAACTTAQLRTEVDSGSCLHAGVAGPQQ